jgi:hypothetical protein
MRNLLFLVFAAALAPVVACSSNDTSATGSGGDGGSAPTSTTSSTGDASTTSSASTGVGGGGTGGSGIGGEAAAPSVSMTIDPATSPPGGTVTATVTVTNFDLVEPTGQPNQAGQGHYHIYLDDASGGNYLVAGQTPTVALHIPATASVGAHTLRVSISDNDHQPLIPAVQAIVDLDVH